MAAITKSKQPIEDAIKELQEKILNEGGVELRAQKAKVDNIQEQLNIENDRLTQIRIEKNSKEKTQAKLEKSLEKKQAEEEEIQAQLSDLQSSREEHMRPLRNLEQELNDAEHEFSEAESQLASIKSELDQQRNIHNEIKSALFDMKASFEELKRNAKVRQFEQNQCKERIAGLAIQKTGFEEEPVPELPTYSNEELENMYAGIIEKEVAMLKGSISVVAVAAAHKPIDKLKALNPNLSVLEEYKKKAQTYMARAKDVEDVLARRDKAKENLESLRKRRLEEFMEGFTCISQKLKEMYQARIVFSVMPPKKSWKNIANLSGGEKTLSSLALVFALHHYKPTPLYVMDEIDAALDFRNVSIVGNYIKEQTQN
ncbi:hypothetical protein HK405_014074, partial [Cladochytrium tenue]